MYIYVLISVTLQGNLRASINLGDEQQIQKKVPMCLFSSPNYLNDVNNLL